MNSNQSVPFQIFVRMEASQVWADMSGHLCNFASVEVLWLLNREQDCSMDFQDEIWHFHGRDGWRIRLLYIMWKDGSNSLNYLWFAVSTYQKNMSFLTIIINKSKILQDSCTVNDPLGQTPIHASSDHYSYLSFVLFCEILKSGDGRTDNSWENSDHYRPWLWVGLMNHL